MAAGKSSVATQLAAATSRPTAVVDELVAARTGLPVSRIFETRGERTFRELEMEALAGLEEDRNLVVDTGGGVVESPAAVELLRSRGVVIWLDAPWEVLLDRLRDGEKEERPLVDRLGWAGLEELFHRRRRLYAAAADFRLRHRRESVADTARTVMLRSLIWERRQEGKR